MGGFFGGGGSGSPVFSGAGFDSATTGNPLFTFDISTLANGDTFSLFGTAEASNFTGGNIQVGVNVFSGTVSGNVFVNDGTDNTVRFRFDGSIVAGNVRGVGFVDVTQIAIGAPTTILGTSFGFAISAGTVVSPLTIAFIPVLPITSFILGGQYGIKTS